MAHPRLRHLFIQRRQLRGRRPAKSTGRQILYCARSAVVRHYIGFSSGGPTILRNVRLARTGEPLLLVDEDAATRVQLDWRDWVATGETISTVTIAAEGCTATVATSSPTATLTISAVSSIADDGKVTVIATSSTGEKWRGIIRVRRTNRYADEQTFRDYA